MAIVWCVVRRGFSPNTKLSGTIQKGVFALANSMNPQPKIVPIVLANFDLLPKDVEYKCKIMEPFRMSDYGIFDPKDPMIDEVVKTIKLRYQKWVKKLCVADQNFEQEITVLKRRSVQKAQQNDLIVFYEPSIRLWDIEQDFPFLNTLNLGFGGAFIHSLSSNFENLFQGLQPKAIILYLGGNDLTLGLSTIEIVNQIRIFIQMIHQNFPPQLFSIFPLNHLLNGKSFWKSYNRLIKGC